MYFLSKKLSMLIESNHFKHGTVAPNFTLLDTQTNVLKTLADVKGEKGTVIFFICNHCPFVVHVNPELVRLANDYSNKGFGFAGISSNDVNYVPQDGPDYMATHAKKMKYPFPYLYDETQEVAKAYDAACTPDFYVFDAELKSVYHGQLDDARPGNNQPLNGGDIRNVLDKLLKDEPITKVEKPSIGCSIKWK